MEKEGTKLKVSTMYGYALAVFGFGLLVGMNTYYTNFYLTDIALIPMVSIASLLLVCRVGDMILVPLVGGLVEKTNMRWGKYRSWLLVGAPLLAIFYTLIYTNLNVSIPMKMVFFTTVYLLAHVFVNLVFGTLYALIPLMTKTNYERSSLSAIRTQLQSFATILFGFIAMPLLLFFTGNGAKVPGATGFTITTGFFAIIMVVMFFIAFLVTKPFDLPQFKNAIVANNGGKKSSISYKEITKRLFKNQHIIALITADTLRLVGIFGFSGLLAYYFIYVLNDLPMLAVFLGSTGIISFVIATIFPLITKKVDKRTMYILGYAIVVVSQLCAWIFAKDTTSFIFFIVFHYIGMTFSNCAGPAMYADATDYSENQFGKEGKGFLMSMANMPPKIALIITGSLTALMLSSIGYYAGIESTPEIISGIKKLTHFMPAITAGLALIVTVLFNKLTIAKVQEIQKEISEKAQLENI